MAVFCTGATIPYRGKLLSDYAEGEVVYLEESGELTPFYVAKHNYESGLNGTGRTLLVRTLSLDYITIWGSFDTSTTTYNGNTVDTYLNESYIKRFSSKVKSAIGTTKIYSVQDNTSSTIVTLTRKAFALSATELGHSSSYHKVEGTELPTAFLNKLLDGSAATFWTRTPYNRVTSADVQRAMGVNATGDVIYFTVDQKHDYVPAFTFPATALFNPTTNVFRGV
jgi:hypothetical protein